MKSLVQIEPRTPISLAPFIISNSGSYYFTTNLTGTASAVGITVLTNDVSIDMNGFALIGVPGSLEGVTLSGQLTNVSIANGTIRNWASQGINALNDVACNFSNLKILNNANTGIWSGPATTVKDCLAMGNNSIGISTGENCLIENCVARLNGYGIAASQGSTIRNCSCVANANYGFYAYSGSVVEACSARGNGSVGITAYDGCTVRGCSAVLNGSSGILVNNGVGSAGASTVSDCSTSANLADGIYVNASGCSLIGNTCSYNGTNGATNFAGIRVDGSQNRIEGNNLAGNHGRGLRVLFFGNFIVRNSASQNTVNYDLVAGQTSGPEVTATGVITTNNPWANFSF